MTRNNGHTLVFERNPVESSRELQETEKVDEDTMRGRVKEKIKIKKKSKDLWKSLCGVGQQCIIDVFSTLFDVSGS